MDQRSQNFPHLSITSRTYTYKNFLDTTKNIIYLDVSVFIRRMNITLHPVRGTVSSTV